MVVPPIASVLLVWEGERGAVRAIARRRDHRPLLVVRAVSTGGLILNDAHASRHHATLRWQMEGVLVEDHGRNGTFINGVPITQHTRANDGDVIRVGDSLLVVRMRHGGSTEDVAIPGLDGDSPGMEALRRGIAAGAPTDARVLVQGETGTGKEATARAIHERSGRKGDFVAVNCAAIPDTLAESQLFGHVRGAFTDARSDHAGFFRAAEGGTLLLDEIGELSPALQAKLLRALEERSVLPVGGTRTIPIDVRLVAATHRDLDSEVDQGSFRGDLYARIAEYTLRTVPLRARREDILPILAGAMGPDVTRISPDLAGALLAHDYRFNVRELLAIARQLVVDGAGSPHLEVNHAGGRLERGARISTPDTSGSNPWMAAAEPTRGDATPPQSTPRAEGTPRSREAAPSRELVEALMAEARGNISEVARALGRSRRQVHRYIETYALDPESYR